MPYTIVIASVQLSRAKLSRMGPTHRQNTPTTQHLFVIYASATTGNDRSACVTRKYYRHSPLPRMIFECHIRVHLFVYLKITVAFKMTRVYAINRSSLQITQYRISVINYKKLTGVFAPLTLAVEFDFGKSLMKFFIDFRAFFLF